MKITKNDKVNDWIDRHWLMICLVGMAPAYLYLAYLLIAG